MSSFYPWISIPEFRILLWTLRKRLCKQWWNVLLLHFNEFFFSLGDFGKSACPTDTLQCLWSFWSPDKFFQILGIGVPSGKCPILTQVLVKQTEFAPVQPPPPTPWYLIYLPSKLWQKIATLKLSQKDTSSFQCHLGEAKEIFFCFHKISPGMLASSVGEFQQGKP